MFSFSEIVGFCRRGYCLRKSLMLFLYQNIYYTGKCSKVSLKAFTLNNQWSFGVDPKYPLVDLPNLQTFTISTQMQTFTKAANV